MQTWDISNEFNFCSLICPWNYYNTVCNIQYSLSDDCDALYGGCQGRLVLTLSRQKLDVIILWYFYVHLLSLNVMPYLYEISCKLHSSTHFWSGYFCSVLPLIVNYFWMVGSYQNHFHMMNAGAAILMYVVVVFSDGYSFCTQLLYQWQIIWKFWMSNSDVYNTKSISISFRIKEIISQVSIGPERYFWGMEIK